MVKQNDGNFEVDVSPEMRLYKIFQAQSYGIDTALAEFIDNSIQSFQDQKQAIYATDGEQTKLRITITVDTKTKMISIKDNAGGINRKDFQRAIRMGHEDNFSHGSDSLSLYGIGMKTAAVWLSSTWQIETSATAATEKLFTQFDLDQLLTARKDKILVIRDNEKPENHYTQITINNTPRTLDEQTFKNTILPYLQETYFKFKDEVDIELIFNNLVLSPESKKIYLQKPEPLIYPPVDKQGNKQLDKKDVRWHKQIELSYAGKKVKGFIMLINPGSYNQPGLRLLRNRRVILGTQGGNKQNRPELLYGTKNKYAGQRIYGELKLNDFEVNYQKTGFTDDLDGLYHLLRTKINDYIEQATNYRARKVKGGKKTSTSKSPASKKIISSSPHYENINFSDRLHKLLDALDNKKLARLYTSICKISLKDHPVLAYVGAWSLLEAISKHMGSKDNTAFNSFLNSKIDQFINDKGKRKEYREPVRDIHAKGNLNKHSGTYETINAEQLAIDFQIMEPFLIHCIQEVLDDKAI